MVKRGVHPNYMKTSNLTCKTLGMFRDQAGIIITILVSKSDSQNHGLGYVAYNNRRQS